MNFFLCPHCKTTWQHPIFQCPYCGEKLIRKKIEGKIKVLSVCQVSVPTFLHPKIPYFVLLLEDEGGHRWVQKSEKEYKEGEILEIKKAQDPRNAVCVWRIKYDFFQAIETIFELLSVKILPRFKILILPTLDNPLHPYFKENTSPEFLNDLLEFLFSRGIKKENIKVIGQSFNQYEIGVSAVKSQLFNVCQSHQIVAVDLSKEKFVLKDQLEIFQGIFEADLILNLSMLKHEKIQSLENLLKLIKKENYLTQEYLFSKEEIVKKLVSLLPPFLTLGQGDVIKRRDKKHFILDTVLGSFNVFNLERVFFEISLPHSLPDLLKAIKITDIEVVGRKISEVQLDGDNL